MNNEERAAYMRTWRLRNLNVERERDRERYWIKRRGAQLQRQRLRTERVKMNVLRHYKSGGKVQCACCGETTTIFLLLDHVNDDGGMHRKQVLGNKKYRMGLPFYLWLIENNYPRDPPLQILCRNCHVAKQSHDGCPHRLN